MKIRILTVCFVVFYQLAAFANGENQTSSANTYTYKNNNQISSSSTYMYKNTKSYNASIAVALYPGSLKNNIDRIARENGWKMVWNEENDYQWVTYTRIEKPSFAEVMKAILADYPLQGVFYEGNQVLVIQSRIIK